MKRSVIAIIILLSLILQSCSIMHGTPVESTQADNSVSGENRGGEYLRAVWVSQYELAVGENESCSREAYEVKLRTIMRRCAENGVNTVIVQVRPNSDAFYESDIFPATRYLSGEQGKSPGFDALSVAVSAAREQNMRIEAWINPFRVSSDADISALCESNPARIIYENDPNTQGLIICDKGIFYNPADASVQKLIIDGVREVLRGYDVDGIHFDDYFYPDAEITSDSSAYAEYRSSGGAMSLDDWRRESLSGFVAGVYNAVKSENPDAVFGISCSGDFEKNHDVYYADIAKWCSQSGYIDYIIPQIYYGYENESLPFKSTLEEWKRLIVNDNVKLYAGLAAYKIGKTDGYAGSGSTEWLDSTDVIARQVDDVALLQEYSGYCLFSYSYIFSENLSENAVLELKNYNSVLY